MWHPLLRHYTGKNKNKTKQKQKKNPKIKLKRAPAPNSVSSSDMEHLACEKEKPQLQFCVLQYVIADSEVMPDLYEMQAYLFDSKGRFYSTFRKVL